MPEENTGPWSKKFENRCSTARSLSLCDFAARVVDVAVVVPTAYLEQGHIRDKMLVNVLGGGKNVIPLTRVPYWTL